jgi:pimeloyl-ACP methyl ester carboxylesterase
VRLYTAAYPGDVAGLILVDAVSEREHAAIDELLTPDQRAIGATMPPPQPEGIDIRAVYDELTSRARPLTVPLVVVARGQPLADDELPPSWSPEQRRRREDIRYASQVDMARLSPAGELIVAKGSGHFVHHEQPAIVIAAVRKLVGQWRKLR